MSPEIESLLIGDGAAVGPRDGGDGIGGLVIGVGDGAVSGCGLTLWSHGRGASAAPVKRPSSSAEENGRRRNEAKRQMWKMPLSILLKFLAMSLYGKM